MAADSSRFRAPIGTHDVLPPESARWTDLVATLRARAGRSGFDLVVTPIFEHLEVFQRVGESTDVVRKEMYDFEDKGGRRLALRPEGTAPVVRAFVQHRPPVAVEGLVRRAELPLRAPAEGPLPPALAGRRRGARRRRPERRRRGDRARATASTATSGCATFTLRSTRWATPPSRAAYVERAARRTCSTHGDALGDEFRERVDANPLRVLDTKARRLAGRHRARAADHRAPRRRRRARTSRRSSTGSTRLGIAHELNPRLVRGLDYYTSTTFEFRSRRARRRAERASAAAAATTSSPSRWAARPRPGIGFGIGIERVLIACDAEGVVRRRRRRAVDVFVVDGLGADGDAEVTLLVTELREDGHAGRARLRRPVGEGAVEGSPTGRARAFGVMLGRDEAERERGRGEGPAHRRAGRGAARRSSSAWLQSRREQEDADRMMRTDRAGDLRVTDIGRDVVVCGWVDSRRDHGGVVFLDVRDVAGIVQVVVDPEQPGGADAHRVRGEYVVRVEGTVRAPARGHGQRRRCPPARSRSAATALEVLNEAETPPFPIDDRIDADEVLRLRHRYLDLRRPRHAAQPPHPRAR